MIRAKFLTIAVTLFLFVLVVGCGGEKKSDNGSAADKTESTASNDSTRTIVDTANDVWAGRMAGLDKESRQMFESLNSAIIRLHYGDRSGLYDNEFEYLKDESDFNSYRNFQQVSYMSADSIEWIGITSYEYRGEDQAIVNVVVHFLGPTGERSQYPDVIRMFRHKGRWIKPSVSVWPNQQDYEKIIREAEEAAREEAGK